MSALASSLPRHEPLPKSDRILRAPASRVEPKVFVNPELADPGSLGQAAQDLRALLRDAKKTARDLGLENTRGQRLAHSLAPFLRQHSQLVEQHAKVLKLIDERAGEASALYSLIAERADRIDLFDTTFTQRMSEMRELMATVGSRLTEAQGAVGRIEGQLDAHCKSTCDRINAQIEEAQSRVSRIEEQSSQTLSRLRREFDAHLIQSADDANARIESASDRLESIEESAQRSAGKLHDALEQVIAQARTEIAVVREELDQEVAGAKSCAREAIEETRSATDRLYEDLDRKRTEATNAAIEVEEALDSSKEHARDLLNETRTRIDNTMRLGRLKLDELCNAFTTWIEAGESGINQSIEQARAQLQGLRDSVGSEADEGVALIATARDESIGRIRAASDGASSKFEDAERALTEVVNSVRNELSAFDAAMFARVDSAKQRLEGIVDQEAQRAERIRGTIGLQLDERLAELTAQCDRAQTILLGEHGPDTTGLLAMLEKAESLERAVETADERAAFATRQLEAIREQANQVRKALGRAVLLAADATDQADAKAAMLGTALAQAKSVTDAIAGVVREETEGAD